jgi:hypothetical protein
VCGSGRRTQRTRLIDFDDASVGHFLQQPQQAGLVVAQARVLVVRSDFVDADGLAADGGAHEALAEALRAFEAQHAAACPRPRCLGYRLLLLPVVARSNLKTKPARGASGGRSNGSDGGSTAHGHGGPSLRLYGALSLALNTPVFTTSYLNMLKTSLAPKECHRK